MAAVSEERLGLNVPMAVILLAGEMAGMGVLALPHAMIGTGPAGFGLILYFTLNAIFVGQRLGHCWVMVERMWPEFREECRHPYMVIAEKAAGVGTRHLVSACISITLFGSGCVVIVLCGSFFQNIFQDFGLDLSSCAWMVIITAFLVPLSWLGTPKDFWGAAVGALASTVIGCAMIMVKEGIDSQSVSSCYANGTHFVANHPEPKSPMDFGQAFSSIMFAFAGAGTFPTIQADMRDREKFPTAAVFAMIILCGIYLPMSVVGWWFLGDRVGSSVVDSLCDGPAKTVIEILFLLHLISAFPIILNPPFQFFEEIMKVPSGFGIRRVIFRSLVIATLLIIALSLPSFGAILNLIGATTITLLNFVFPPLFYLMLTKKYRKLGNVQSEEGSSRERDNNTIETCNEQLDVKPVSTPMKIYCWHLVLVSSVGGIVALVSSLQTIGSDFGSGGDSCWSQL